MKSKTTQTDIPYSWIGIINTMKLIIRYGNSLQYSCLENYMDGGTWQTTVHGVARSRTQLSLHTQSNLLIQCNPYQITKGIFHRTRTKFFTICIETHKTPEQPKQSFFSQAMPSSRGSSQPRDQTHVSYVSCIGKWVLYHQQHL